MTKRTRRKFSKEYKTEAVRMCESRSVAEVAESLGVSVELLYRWSKDKEKLGADAFRGKGNRTAMEEENYQLRKENARLKEEQEILKKASAYFAKHLR